MSLDDQISDLKTSIIEFKKSKPHSIAWYPDSIINQTVGIYKSGKKPREIAKLLGIDSIV
jgi:hypothetical protein